MTFKTLNNCSTKISFFTWLPKQKSYYKTKKRAQHKGEVFLIDFQFEESSKYCLFNFSFLYLLYNAFEYLKAKLFILGEAKHFSKKEK